ncbi:MAG: ornithine--oxo-acid transaminase [Anaerolineales bacterium]|nr:ornithine--oxo-acid transaminase [Anaerolineales bacterium]
MHAKDYIALEENHGAHNYHPLDVVIERGEGAWVWDVEGRRYLDFLSAYSALNQGHRHPRIMAALSEQAARVTLTSRAFRNDQLGLLYQDLYDMLGYDLALPMNTGAEAVETAIKVARKWGYVVKGIPRHEAEIIVADGNFHGRTITVISFSTEPHYRDDFGPFTPGFTSVPFGDAAALEAAITPRTCAIMLEPIQGEAGVVVPPPGYLRAAADMAARHQVLLIADEIQTGLGRTGKLLSSDHEGVRPDLVILGKALGGGVYPVSAVLADRPILGLIQPGEHGSTFGGNPLGAAVARAALAVLREEGLADRAHDLGTYFMERLVEIPSPLVKEVRGQGLLIGVELKPEAGGARRYCEALMGRGILCKETHQNVIRFAPPLVIDRDALDWAVPHITDVLNPR